MLCNSTTHRAIHTNRANPTNVNTRDRVRMLTENRERMCVKWEMPQSTRRFEFVIIGNDILLVPKHTHKLDTRIPSKNSHAD